MGTLQAREPGGATLRPTVLVVEDHDALRRSLHEWIQAVFPDCSVVEARSGEEAVVNAPLFLPAIILMDVGLPGMNGIEATRRLKALLPTVRIVMLTILESDAYRTEAAAAGACAFVTKRHMHSELMPVLGALLEPFSLPTPASERKSA
jgi:DNA-binding NarL/FixJ family response regulator